MKLVELKKQRLWNKNSLDKLNSKLYITKEKTGSLEDVAIKTIPMEAYKKSMKENLSHLWKVS